MEGEINIGVVFLGGVLLLGFLYFVYSKIKARKERGNMTGRASGGGRRPGTRQH